MDESSSVVIELPWPPSVNHYWRRCGTRYFVSEEGKNYRNKSYFTCIKLRGFFTKEERLSVTIEAHPPDKRRRDLDNILKSLLDSLQYANVYNDDNQIDEIHIKRIPSLEAKVVVKIQSILK